MAESAGDFVQAQLDSWEGDSCPYCGQLAVPTWISLLNSYTFHCAYCGQVIESFELYHDEEGLLYTSDHVRWLMDDGISEKPYRVHVEQA